MNTHLELEDEFPKLGYLNRIIVKNVVAYSIWIIMIVVFTSCNGSNPNEEANADNADVETTENIRKIIDKKNAELEALFAEGNADSISTYFSADAIQMSPNQLAIEGNVRIRDMWKESMSFGQWNLSFEAQDVKHSGNLAVERGKYTLNFKPNLDSPIPSMKDHGNYVVLWEKIGGDWKIVWDAPVSEMPLHPMDSLESVQ